MSASPSADKPEPMWYSERVSGPDDPEHERVQALLQRSLAGTATDAESEELALYATDRPDLRDHIEAQVQRGALGHGWLERVQRDQSIAEVDGSRRAQLERGVGLTLLLSGWLLVYLSPVVGGPVAGAGLLILLYSLIRVRLATHAQDPYKDIER